MRVTPRLISRFARRALREWQQAHREPCDDCTWVEVQAMCDIEPRLVLGRACPKHGGNQ